MVFMIAQRQISFSPPDITQVEIDEVVDTLNSGWITTGPKTKRLESELADFVGIGSTGTDGHSGINYHRRHRVHDLV